MTPSIAQNILDLRNRISELELKYEREPGSVQLIAVSKTCGWEKVAAAFACGQRDFGENYLQEALDKKAMLEEVDLCWHFIGPVQSNKTRDIALHFDWVHSVDREKIARRLGAQRPPGRTPLNLLIQVNLSEEPSKSGIGLAEVPTLARQIEACEGVSLQGLMAIPAPSLDFDSQRNTFSRLTAMRDQLLHQGFADCRHLSMGMSADFEAAIAAGATMIRIGTDIFGPRDS